MNDHLTQAHAKPLDLDALCARQQLARDHAALFPARLALARWQGGCSAARPSLEQPSARATWFARIGRDHQAWLDRGGFAQHEELPPLRQPTMWQPSLEVPLPRPAQDSGVAQCAGLAAVPPTR